MAVVAGPDVGGGLLLSDRRAAASDVDLSRHIDLAQTHRDIHADHIADLDPADLDGERNLLDRIAQLFTDAHSYCPISCRVAKYFPLARISCTSLMLRRNAVRVP